MDAVDLLRRCFPGGGGKPLHYVALSGSCGLRWILPSRRPEISRLLASWQPYGFFSVIGWRMFQRAARVGVLHYMPGAQPFQAELGVDIWRNFGWEGKAAPLLALYVGTKGPQQKAVAILCDPDDGNPQLVVKFPLGESAWPAIVREYHTLFAIKTDRSALAPRPQILNGEKRFSVQSWLEGGPTGVGIGPAHIAFLASLARTGDTVSLSDLRTALRERLSRMDCRGALAPETTAAISDLLDKGERLGQVLAVRVHGDFAPWNLKWLKNGGIAAIDWEDSKPLGLPFYDLHYYHEQTQRLLGRRVVVPWSHYEEALSGLGHSSGTALKEASCLAKASAILAVRGGRHGAF